MEAILETIKKISPHIKGEVDQSEASLHPGKKNDLIWA